MTSAESTHGVVLFAHGSRDPLWRKPMEAVALRMTELEPDVMVRCAFLELSSPDLSSTAAELVAQGMNRLTIVPMFLGVGKHAREDLPILITQLKSDHPEVTIELQPSIGENTKLIDLLAHIALCKT